MEAVRCWVWIFSGIAQCDSLQLFLCLGLLEKRRHYVIGLSVRV